jgi:1,4-dihydroxy-2-naphthoate octaprenyltransferase
VKYTVGKNAYGYSGLGDIFVFLFFGVLSVLGSYFLFTKTLQWQLLLPAISIGCFSTAVLNLNNMRDIESDTAAKKHTLVVKLGGKKAKEYHAFLLLFGMVCAIFFTIINYREPLQFVYLIAFIPFLLNIKTVFKNKSPMLLDGELKKVALSTFLFAILFSIFM